MVENLIEIYFSNEIDINIDIKFDQALKPRIIFEYRAIRIISSISAGVCEWGFLILLSILLSEICLNIHILPFIRSRYSLKFHAHIAGDSGSLDFKIYRGNCPGPPPPPPCASDSHLRRWLRNSMTTRIKLASPLHERYVTCVLNGTKYIFCMQINTTKTQIFKIEYPVRGIFKWNTMVQGKTKVSMAYYSQQMLWTRSINVIV